MRMAVFAREMFVGLHVMRREKGFGEAYGKNRTGEWEYVEYRADRTYITPPQKSFACAECHVKAGSDRDFVYRGRFPEKEADKYSPPGSFRDVKDHDARVGSPPVRFQSSNRSPLQRECRAALRRSQLAVPSRSRPAPSASR